MNIYPSLKEMVIQGLSKDARTAYDTMTDVEQERLVNHELFHMAALGHRHRRIAIRHNTRMQTDRYISEILAGD